MDPFIDSPRELPLDDVFAEKNPNDHQDSGEDQFPPMEPGKAPPRTPLESHASL
jgi:hypothetical protein